MVIKMACIGGGHGCNAVRYAMDKDSSVTVLRTHGLVDCIFEPTSSDVWNAMKMDISNSHHKVGDALFRIEICPAAEECAGWTDEDWQQCLDDAIRHLNSTPHVGKGGKVLARPTELDRCKWVAAMHHDTDNPHIHLVACRITEDDRVQDSYKCETRALMAADAMARERGWTRAQDKDNERKERIHADAIAVLKEMRQFNAGLFLAEMQGRGWIIKAQRDGTAACPGTVRREDVQIAVFEDDSPMTRKIKLFMAAYGIVDIKMRMLKITELKKIMGFPETYILVGTQAEQKKYIGNAVECGMARQLCESLWYSNNSLNG